MFLTLLLDGAFGTPHTPGEYLAWGAVIVVGSGSLLIGKIRGIFRKK